MIRDIFVRRRQIWLPTIWGGLLLLTGLCAMAVIGARNLHAFLAQNSPVGASLLVVEGWMDPADLDQAARVFREGGYQRVVTTGGPIDSWLNRHYATFAEMAAEYLKAHGLQDVSIVAVPAPFSAQDRTFLSAVMVREWAESSRLTEIRLDIFSSGTHARRSRHLYQLAFGPGAEIGVLAAKSLEYDAAAWWRSSAGVRDVLNQSIGWLWARCFFRPPKPDSHEERWAVPPAPGNTNSRAGGQRLTVRVGHSEGKKNGDVGHARVQSP